MIERKRIQGPVTPGKGLREAIDASLDAWDGDRGGILLTLKRYRVGKGYRYVVDGIVLEEKAFRAVTKKLADQCNGVLPPSDGSAPPKTWRPCP